MPSLRYVVAWYLLVSLLTIGLYGIDKWRASRSTTRNGLSRRVPERTLHLIELLGGWPGALVGQQLFRHKRSKSAYMRVFWAIVVLHVVVWLWWLFR